MSKFDAVTNASALMFHEAEVMNRQVTMVTAYKLALEKFDGDTQKAAEEAVRETQLINGGATLETGPRYARSNIERVALMYKAYGIQMYYTMFKSGRQAVENFFPGDDAKSKTLRDEALKQLAGVHLSACSLQERRDYRCTVQWLCSMTCSKKTTKKMPTPCFGST